MLRSGQWRTGVRWAAVLGATATLAACGSDASDDADTESAASGTTAAETAETTEAATPTKLSSTPIKIGTICSCTGAVSSSSAAVPATLTAWVKWTNDNGGINGHPVELVQLDDGLDAATSVKQAKQLVEQEKVVAIVGQMSNLDALWADYVEEAGIPVIGAAIFNTPFENNPTFFPVGAQNPAEVYGNIMSAKDAGKPKIGVMPCAEAPACSNYATLFKQIGEMVGGDVELVFNQKITGTQPNYTATCLAAKSAGVETLVVLAAPSIVTRVADDCAKQAFKPFQVNVNFTSSPDWADNANLEGAVTVSPNLPLWDRSKPNEAFNAALDKYAPGIRDRPEFNPSNATAWASGEVFRVAAERAKLTPTSTPADLKKGLYTFDKETLDGLTAPLTFTEGSPPNLVDCYFLNQIKDGEWTAPQGAEPTCIAPELVEQVAATMTKR